MKIFPLARHHYLRQACYLLFALCLLSDNWQLLVKHSVKQPKASVKHIHVQSIGSNKSNVWQTSVRCVVLVCQMLCLCLTHALACLTDALGCLSDAWGDASQTIVSCLTRSTKQIASAWRKRCSGAQQYLLSCVHVGKISENLQSLSAWTMGSCSWNF